MGRPAFPTHSIWQTHAFFSRLHTHILRVRSPKRVTSLVAPAHTRTHTHPSLSKTQYVPGSHVLVCRLFVFSILHTPTHTHTHMNLFFFYPAVPTPVTRRRARTGSFTPRERERRVLEAIYPLVPSSCASGCVSFTPTRNRQALQTHRRTFEQITHTADVTIRDMFSHVFFLRGLLRDKTHNISALINNHRALTCSVARARFHGGGASRQKIS